MVTCQHVSSMFKYVHKNLPVNLSKLFQSNNQIHQHNTRQRNAAQVIHYSYKVFANSFLHRSSLEWQRLPETIKIRPTHKSFIKYTKRHILEIS